MLRNEETNDNMISIIDIEAGTFRRPASTATRDSAAWRRTDLSWFVGLWWLLNDMTVKWLYVMILKLVLSTFC